MEVATVLPFRQPGRRANVGDFDRMGQFDLIKELHRSGCGSVHLARVRPGHPKARLQLVLKRLQVAELGRAKDMMNEYTLLKRLQHPNIIECEGYFWDSDTEALVLVLEYADRGDLFTEMQRRREKGQQFSNDEVCNIFTQIVQGLAHMHSKGIVHRDIKSLNLLLTSAGQVKLGDFGISRQLSDNTLFLNSFHGTPLYLSPELVEGRPYSEPTDIWSLGVVLYELLTLQSPFSGRSLPDIVLAVVRGEYPALPPSRIAEFGPLVAELLTKEADKRPRADELLQRLSGIGWQAQELASCGSVRGPPPAAGAACRARRSGFDGEVQVPASEAAMVEQPPPLTSAQAAADKDECRQLHVVKVRQKSAGGSARTPARATAPGTPPVDVHRTRQSSVPAPRSRQAVCPPSGREACRASRRTASPAGAYDDD